MDVEYYDHITPQNSGMEYVNSQFLDSTMNAIIARLSVLTLSTELIQASAIYMPLCSERSERFRGLLDKIKVGRILECYECRIILRPPNPSKPWCIVCQFSISGFNHDCNI